MTPVFKFKTATLDIAIYADGTIDGLIERPVLVTNFLPFLLSPEMLQRLRAIDMESQVTDGRASTGRWVTRLEDVNTLKAG